MRSPRPAFLFSERFLRCLMGHFQRYALTALLLSTIALLTIGSPSLLFGQLQKLKLRSAARVLDSNAPLSFPEKVVAGSHQDLYILDTELSNVFVVNQNSGESKPLCTPRMPVSPSDMSVDKAGYVWVIDSQAKRVAKLDEHCKMQASFVCRSFPIGLQINAFGEIIVLTAEGESLFDIYSSGGRLIRSFGKRLRYGDEIADQELSDGHLIADESGGFYFSLNYPPLVRHYAREGRLLAEFKPDSEVRIDPPEISSQRQGNRLNVRSKYQILVLDFALDGRGRLILLMSGENKYQALTNGSRSLLVTTTSGRVLSRLDLEDGPFNRLAAGERSLFLLRNRSPLRLDRFTIP
jgi:hypothetical protein